MSLRYIEVEYTQFYRPHPYPTYYLEDTEGPESYFMKIWVKVTPTNAWKFNMQVYFDIYIKKNICSEKPTSCNFTRLVNVSSKTAHHKADQVM